MLVDFDVRGHQEMYLIFFLEVVVLLWVMESHIWVGSNVLNV